MDVKWWMVIGTREIGAVLVITVLLTSAVYAAQAVRSSILPYPIYRKTLNNGLDVVVIETPEFKNVLSYNTLVLAGARNETEPGKTGLAHLFEHILFRHRYRGEDGGYEHYMTLLGTHNNAWTWFDVTYYHPLTFAQNLYPRTTDFGPLPSIVELEADRFVRLDFTQKIFQTEAGAVLGEYRRISSFPSLKMSEKLLALMFPHHSYGHTTIGYYEDVLDMPNEYAAALRFYRTYYRPNNVVLVIVGDVRAEDVFAQVSRYYTDWEPHATPPVRPKGTPPQTEQRAHVPWPADVAPLVWVAYRMPAYRPGTVESGVMDLLQELLVSEAAPLYQRLRYEKQSVSLLNFAEGTRGFESFDPRVLIIQAQLYKDRFQQQGTAYFDEVIRDIVAGVEALQTFDRAPDAKQRLQILKSKFRYDFMAQLSSPARIAEIFAWYYRFNRDPRVLDQVVRGVQRVRPKDVAAFARRYLIPERRVILTLAYEPQSTSEESNP